MTDASQSSPEHVGTVVGAAYGLVALASSATAVVVPAIRDEFDLSLATSSWVITAFVIALAATAPIYGRLADRAGARAPVTVGLSLMAVGAAASALAPDIAFLVAARAIQGAGAGAIPVLAPVIIAARTTDTDRPRALTRMSSLAAAAAAGLLLGAVLSEVAGWRPVLALPVAALALVAPIRRLAERRNEPTGAINVAGAAGVAAVAVGLNLLLQLPSSAMTGTAGIGLLIAGGALTVVSGRHRAPFIPQNVLRRPITWQAGVAAAAIPAAYFALLIAIPTILTDRHGATRITVGLLLFPAAVAGAAVGPVARALRARLTDPHVAVASLVMAVTALMTASLTASHPLGLAVAFALVAVSFGLGQATLLGLLTAATPPEERGAALAVFMVVFFVGGGIGGTLLVTLADATSLTTAIALVATLPAAAAALAASTTEHEPR